MHRTCFRCDCDLHRPHTQNANYVQGVDTTDTESVEVFYALRQTDETRAELDRVDERLPSKHRQAIAAEMAHPNAPDTVMVSDGTETIESGGGAVESAVEKEIAFSVDVEKYDHVPVDSPNVVQDDDEVAFVYSVMEETEVQKTGLVCSDCTTGDDDIIWGVDE